MRTLLLSILVVLSLSAQTKVSVGQIGNCPANGNYFVMSSNGQSICVLADPANWKFAPTSDPAVWKIEALWPSVEDLTSRVTSLESRVTVLEAQQPTVDVFVVASDGQSFTATSSPRWGYAVIVRNGVVQTSGKDYTLMGKAVTFSGGQPKVGDLIRIEYFK